jgi:hypothetical protein
MELRRRMGRASVDPLPAFDVATFLEVTVLSPTDIKGVPEVDLHRLLNDGHQEWSGITLRLSDWHLVVVNTAQSPRRQNSVLMHELAHIILGHELPSGTISGEGHFIPANFNQDQEDEAAWFGATLLLPRPALLWMRRRRMTDDQAASHFGVSPDLLTWRIRMTRIDFQLSVATRNL